MFVCLSVIIDVVVDKGQSIRVFVFLHKRKWVCVVLRIPNLEGHQNCMIGSKLTTIFTTFFVHDYLGFFWICNQSTLDNGGASRGRSVALVTGGR